MNDIKCCYLLCNIVYYIVVLYCVMFFFFIVCLFLFVDLYMILVIV